MQSILIVDDESAMRKTLQSLLKSEGYSVRTARNGDEALAMIRETRPDLVLLDVMMPRQNGFAVCEEIRKTDRLLPVLFLTALDVESNQVRGFGLGADDYIAKTAGDAELLARIRRALDRADDYASQALGDRLRLGSVAVDLIQHTVRDGKRTAMLTSTETDLLRCLATRRGEMHSVEEIFSYLRGTGYVGEHTTLRVHVMNLRRKLGRAGDMVANVSNVGYYLVK